jgi:hypothetical protein
MESTQFNGAVRRKADAFNGQTIRQDGLNE